jgi:hypothetical protein
MLLGGLDPVEHGRNSLAFNNLQPGGGVRNRRLRRGNRRASLTRVRALFSAQKVATSPRPNSLEA